MGDDLWLNEGFACWMQTFAADKLHPEWNLWESFIGNGQKQALSLDSLRSSHPIQVPIGKAEEVEEVFDAISYMKGGSTVRMIYAVLGQEKFQEGLRLYFDRHKYGNTETSHLWKAWADASGQPLPDMMSSWTEKMGFPVLKVLNDPFAQYLERNASGYFEVSLECEQSYFLADGSTQPGDEEKTWYIPVMVGSDVGKITHNMTSKDKKATIEISFASAPSWIKLNFGQHVPMRVLYPEGMISCVAAKVQTLSAEDRIGLLSDSFALCKAGMQQPEQLVQLMSGFSKEKNDKVWGELSANLSALDSILKQCLEGPAIESWNRFAAALTVPTFLEVGWDTRSGDDDNTKLLRNTLAALMAKFCSADAEHMKAAKQKCEAFLQAATEGQDTAAVVSADVRAAVLTCAMKADANSAMFDKFVCAHNKTDDGTVRQHIYAAVANAPNPLRQRALAWALTDEIRPQDLIYLPMHVNGTGREGAEDCFQWMQTNYDKIYALLGETSMILFQHMVKISGRGFASEEKAAEVEKFWKSKPVINKIAKSLQQTVESITTNAQFATRIKASRLANPDFWTELSKSAGL